MKKDKSYEPNPFRKAVDTLVALVPQINPVTAPASIIYSILGKWYNTTRINRLEDIVEDFSAAIEALGEHKIDRDFMKTEEYELTVVDLVDKSTRSKSDAKRRCFKNILVSLVDKSRDKPTWDDVDIYLSMLNEMNDVHINVLGLVCGYGSSEVERNNMYVDWDSQFPSAGEDMLVHGLNGLEKLGLITPGRMKVSNYGTRAVSYLVTDLAKAFYDYCVR